MTGVIGVSEVSEATMSVGAFARRCGTTARAVRHYDRIGLLIPARVDPDTGYRAYAAGQIPVLQLIARLRDLDVPLADVARCLTGGGQERVTVLARQRTRLEARLTRTRGQIHLIDHLLTDGWETTMTTDDSGEATPDHRRLGVDLFNGTWELMSQENRTPDDDDLMVHMAHASAYHWRQAGTAVNWVRSHWLCSRVYAVLRRGEPSLVHAQRVLDLCAEHGIADWDLAFGHEAVARAHAVSGDAEAARAATEAALAAAEAIADPDDRALVLSDLESIPGQPRFW